MRIAAKTDTGKVRTSNQDSYATGELPDGVVWAVVCDGMGGAAGGNIASTMAVRMIAERITECYHPGMRPSSVQNVLESAITSANVCLYDMSCANESLTGMGTTVVAAVVIDGIACIAHAGDSRAYLISKNGLRQVTTDHSLVQEMVEDGRLTPDEAKNHPIKNYITRALGTSEDIEIDFSREPMGEDDVLLICTDGLTNFVDDETIFGATGDDKYYEYAQRLVDLANLNGGGDNITVVSIAY